MMRLDCIWRGEALIVGNYGMSDGYFIVKMLLILDRA
jgi:hypothetical protein